MRLVIKRELGEGRNLSGNQLFVGVEALYLTLPSQMILQGQ